MAIGVAILGAGIFARTGDFPSSPFVRINIAYCDHVIEHLPAVQACSDLELKAVFSRSEKSAQALASGVASVDAYYENPQEPSRTLSKLLAREDIQAVIVALPINNQPVVIRQCIEAGKHVLSEKPVARDVKDGLELVKWYEANRGPQKPIWGVAENWRYGAEHLKAVEVLKGLKEDGGKLVTFRLEAFVHMSQKSDYYHTEW